MTLNYKMPQVLLKNKQVIVLQNMTKVYYKMLSAFFITKCDSFDSYYKMRRYSGKQKKYLKMEHNCMKKTDVNS